MISHKSMVSNILHTFEKATPKMIEEGIMWYPRGQMLILNISSLTGYTEEQVATAMAHLSPRVQWVRNVFVCTALCHGQPKPSGAMSRSWNQALAALTHEDPLSTLKGDKVKRFAGNLLGDRQSVAVDIWGIRTVTNFNESKLNLKHVGVYAKVEEAYQAAATQIGIEPANLQAVTWVVARNGRSK